MGVVDGFKSASIFGKIAFILLAVASFCIIIAFTCTGWGESNTTVGGGYRIHWGLWRRCTEEEVSTAPCNPLDGWANGMSFRLFFLLFFFVFCLFKNTVLFSGVLCKSQIAFSPKFLFKIFFVIL